MRKISTALFLLAQLKLFSVQPLWLSGKYGCRYLAGEDKKPKHTPISGWDYNSNEITEQLTLNSDGTFVIERISPQGGFYVLPVKGKWKLNSEGILELSGCQSYEGLDPWLYHKTFSTFNGKLTEVISSKKKSPIVWIKQT